MTSEASAQRPEIALTKAMVHTSAAGLAGTAEGSGGVTLWCVARERKKLSSAAARLIAAAVKVATEVSCRRSR